MTEDAFTRPEIADYPVDYVVTELDALGYVRQCWLASLILLISYIWTVQEGLPLAGLILVVIVMLPRWMIGIHELIHIYSPEQLNRVLCILGTSPVPLSLLSLSYAEIRALHLAHHRAPATDDDPDAYHIRGAGWWVFLNALTSPEQNAIRWIAAHGLSGALAIELLIKAGLLVALAWFGGLAFFWFWLTLRLVHGLSDFAFFRCVHYRQGDYGTFALSLHPVLIRMGEWVFGPTVVHTTLNHDLHHQYPAWAARSLRLARAQYKHEQ